jgi:hypothetical protein
VINRPARRWRTNQVRTADLEALRASANAPTVQAPLASRRLRSSATRCACATEACGTGSRIQEIEVGHQQLEQLLTDAVHVLCLPSCQRQDPVDRLEDLALGHPELRLDASSELIETSKVREPRYSQLDRTCRVGVLGRRSERGLERPEASEQISEFVLGGRPDAPSSGLRRVSALAGCASDVHPDFPSSPKGEK